MQIRYFWALNALLSIIAVGAIFWAVYFTNSTMGVEEANATILPGINALLNGLTALFVITGLILIKKRKITEHKIAMILGFFTSFLFVVFYLYYHSIYGDSHFLGEGYIRGFYFFILISHIILSIIIFPLVTASFFFGITGRISGHKNLVRFTYPGWLYVSITGVLIYVLLEIYGRG